MKEKTEREEERKGKKNKQTNKKKQRKRRKTNSGPWVKPPTTPSDPTDLGSVVSGAQKSINKNAQVILS